MPKKSEVFTVANVVTISRFIIGIIGLVVIHYYKWTGFTLVTFSFALDKVDGWAAQYIDKRTTNLGAMLDRLADKGLIIGVFFYLSFQGLANWIPTILIISGELILAVQAIQSFENISRKETDKLKAGWPGKIKMLMECLSGLAYFIHWQMVGNILIIVAIIMMVLSIYDHIKRKDP